MQQLRLGELPLPQPPPKPDEFIFGLAQRIERDDLLLVCEREVVGDEIVEVKSDILRLQGTLASLYLLQLPEVIAQLLNDDVAVGATAGQPAILLTEVSLDQLDHRREPLILWLRNL